MKLLRISLFIPAALLEGLALVALVSPAALALPWPIILAGHAAACLLATLAFLPSLPARFRNESWIALLLPLGFAICLPVAGPLVAWVLVRFIAFVQPPPDEQTEYYFGDDPYLTGATVPQLLRENTPRSISELLHQPDVQVRRRAVLAVRNLTPRLALPLLRQAQQDSDEQVRIFARNHLARVVENLESSLKFSTASNSDPKAQLDHVIHVVDQYQEFVDLGLLSDGSRTTYLQRAADLLGEINRAEPENEKVVCSLLRINLLRGDNEGARLQMQQLQQISHNPKITLPWELQIHFQNRDWKGITQVLDFLKSESYYDPRFRTLYEFWRLDRGPAKSSRGPLSESPNAGQLS